MSPSPSPHAAGAAPVPLRLVAALALAFGLHGAALASPASDIAELKKALAAMKSDYDKRIGTLESQLHDTQAELAKAKAANAAAPGGRRLGRRARAAPRSPPPRPRRAPAAGRRPRRSTPAATRPPARPAAARTLQSADLADPVGPLRAHVAGSRPGYAITGFALPPGAEIGAGSRGFSLAESELGARRQHRPLAAPATSTSSITGDDTISVEEAFIRRPRSATASSLKAGRFFSGVGYLNSQHSPHLGLRRQPARLPGACSARSTPTTACSCTWLAPIDQYIEFGARGSAAAAAFPAATPSRNGAGMSGVHRSTPAATSATAAAGAPACRC